MLKIQKKLLSYRMLTFTHTYALLQAFEKQCRREGTYPSPELVLGNVIPDFITHLGREEYQKLAHDLTLLHPSAAWTGLEWGMIFHILCDNYSTLGRISFEGDYHEFRKDGFIEQRANAVQMTVPLHVPGRRVLQCALDILVLQEEKDTLIRSLAGAANCLTEHGDAIVARIADLYGISASRLEVGMRRFLKIYGREFIHQAASQEYRLFPLVRSLLDLDTLSEPGHLLSEIRKHPELMELIDVNMGIIKQDWRRLLEEMVEATFTFPGMMQALACDSSLPGVESE
ncbi:MAG: hypothetical protein ACOY90_03570 [Candidatus Zhuqueibacterota bacterium]